MKRLAFLACLLLAGCSQPEPEPQPDLHTESEVCPDCKGNKGQYKFTSDEDERAWLVCQTCKGTGTLDNGD